MSEPDKQKTPADDPSGADAILTERIGEHILLIRIHRPHRRNAFDQPTSFALETVLDQYEQDPTLRCAILTGSDIVFSSGADLIAVRSGKRPVSRNRGLFGIMAAPPDKPIIAAVSGFALGGGCELALMCDFILAADNARFGQPEIKLGVLPGMGGTQRLTRAVGKAKAMEMCLTGRMIDATEAERSGLVARVIPQEQLLEEALKVAAGIAAKSMPVAMMVKESVNRAFEVSLAEGIRFERRVFHAAFATDDQKEGMAAFIEKREPDFKHR